MAIKDYNGSDPTSKLLATTSANGFMSASDKLKINSIVSNGNIADNSCFRINQRRQTTYTCSSNDNRLYTLDRWYILYNNTKVEVYPYEYLNNQPTKQAVKVTFSPNTGEFGQIIEIPISSKNTAMTACMQIDDVRYEVTVPLSIRSGNGDISSKAIGNTGLVFHAYQYYTIYSFYISNSTSSTKTIKIDYIDVFLGSVAYPHIDTNIREDLLKCNRYYEAGYYQIPAASSYYLAGFNYRYEKRAHPTITVEFLYNKEAGGIPVSEIAFCDITNFGVAYIGDNKSKYGTRIYIMKATIDAEIY